MTLPIRWRLVLATTTLMALVLASIGMVILLRFRADLIATVDASLRLRVERLDDSDGASAVTDISGDPDESFGQLLDTSATVVDSSPGVTSGALLTSAQIAGLADPNELFSADVGTVEEVVPARLLAWRTSGGQVAVLGVSIEDQLEATRTLLVLMAAGGAVALVLSGAAGWIVAGFALRPVERMRREADQISGTHQQRLAVPATRDELERLAQTLNDMLDRLDAAVEAQRRFIADASHELRTPLTNLKLEVELALRGPLTIESAAGALAGMREELDSLIALSASLLDLDQAGGRAMQLQLEPVDMVQLVRTQVEQFGLRAASAQVELRLTGADCAIAESDPLRIGQVVSNLLDNAIRHSPPRATVEIAVEVTGSEVVVAVADAGAGLKADASEMFTPFWRADEGRARKPGQPGGAGLGLSISKAIIDAHGGRIWTENRDRGGASFQFAIPSGARTHP